MQQFDSVLIIDDDEVSSFISSRVLTNLNFLVRIQKFRNGYEALQFLNDSVVKDQSLPDTILLDINMPVMSGVEFLEEFKNIPFNKNKIIIIPVSAGVHPKEFDKLKKMGFDKVLLKPISKQKLNAYFNEDTNKEN